MHQTKLPNAFTYDDERFPDEKKDICMIVRGWPVKMHVVCDWFMVK